jgi:hypothetical protein
MELIATVVIRAERTKYLHETFIKFRWYVTQENISNVIVKKRPKYLP